MWLMSSLVRDMQRCSRGDMCKVVYSCPAEYSPRVPFPYWNANQTNNIHLQPIKDIWNGAIWFRLNLKLSGFLSQSFKPHLKCFLSWLDPKIFPFVSINILNDFSLLHLAWQNWGYLSHSGPFIKSKFFRQNNGQCNVFRSLTELILFSGNINHSFFELE